MKFISYAQNFEDVLLWRALGHIRNGFYVDIGAQDPIVDSVSLAFYNAGWRGMHVEPSHQYAEGLRMSRPDEVVREAAVSTSKEEIDLYVITDTGLSTLKADVADAHNDRGYFSTRGRVPVVSLDEILNTCQGKDVHWLKIDVEGAEEDVIKSWAQSDMRPWVVVIESTAPMSESQTHQNWESMILSKGYEFVYFDGLNRFYIHDSHSELKDRFLSPPNIFDDFAVSGTASNSICSLVLEEKVSLQIALDVRKQQIAELTHEGVAQKASISELEVENSEMQQVNAALRLELDELTVRLACMHTAFHRVLTSRAWRATYPFRLLHERYLRWSMPLRVKAFCKRYARLAVLHCLAYVNNSPRLKSKVQVALRKLKVHDVLKAKYLSFTSRPVPRPPAKLDDIGLGDRANELYLDLLRRNRKME